MLGVKTPVDALTDLQIPPLASEVAGGGVSQSQSQFFIQGTGDKPLCPALLALSNVALLVSHE